MLDSKQAYAYLLERLTKLDDSQEMDNFLQDLCTRAELDNMAQRMYAAKLIIEGKTYVDVAQETSLSSATISRISHCVKRGKGGYQNSINKK